MEIEVILQAISTVGFPIFAFIYMTEKMYNHEDKNMERLTELTEAVNNNTIALTKLIEHMEE